MVMASLSVFNVEHVSMISNLISHIVRLAMRHHLFLEFWLVDTWFFADWRHHRAVTRLENVRQSNIRRGKKLGVQLSHKHPLTTHKDSNSSPLSSWSIPRRNGIIQNIKLKITFKPGFIKSEDVNIILFQKERYLRFFIYAYIYFCVYLREPIWV